jgi:hypothetical protein
MPNASLMSRPIVRNASVVAHAGRATGPFFMCAECLADLEAEKITSLQVASYGKFVDEAVIGIRFRDERAITLALNAATDVWDRLIAASPRHTALIAAMEMQFANRVLLHEFEVEDATQKFSAGLRRT